MTNKKSGSIRTFKKQETWDKSLPSISVITVTYNRLQDLSETFSNVISQTYENVEYIVIDGGSQDGTVEFLRQNNEIISYWVSEKDGGIYDAMNKGSLIATGDWIIFMNSGDKFFADDTLALVAEHLNGSEDVVYGGFESILVDRYQTRVFQNKPRHILDLWREIPTCHQSIFVKRKLQVQYLFDRSFVWCADHDFLVRLYANGYKFKEIPILISKFDASDAGSRNLLTYTRERWRISKHIASPLKRHRYFLKEYYGFFLWKNMVKIRDLLPKKWVLALRKYRQTG
ncbi:MAG: glycosyltransferase family 2 protein [Nostoc sp. DedQUE11]|nr:glycosyltransferase family 2 protein [Nostoc sp. DedQUE11]